MYFNSLDETIQFLRNKFPNFNIFDLKDMKKFIIFTIKKDDKEVFGIMKKKKGMKVDNKRIWCLATETWPELASKSSMLRASLDQLERIFNKEEK